MLSSAQPSLSSAFMKSKARKRQEWAYLHTLEIGTLNEEILERQAREDRAAAAAAAAVAPAIPPGQDQLEQLAPEQLQTPPHVQEEVEQPPPRPVKTPPTPPRAQLKATQLQRLQQATALVSVTLAESQPTAQPVVTTPARTSSPSTSVTSSSSASSETSAFLTPQQEAPSKRLPAQSTDTGFFKSIQNTLVAGLGSIASDFNATSVPRQENQSISQPSSSTLTSVQVDNELSSTADKLLSLGAHPSVSSASEPAESALCPVCESSRSFEISADPLEDIVIVCTCGKQAISSSLCPVCDDPLKWSDKTHPSEVKCICGNSDRPKRPNTRFQGVPPGHFSKSTQQYTKHN